MSSAAAAYMSWFSAEQAGAGGMSQFLSGNLGSVCAQYINIKKTSQSVCVFQTGHAAFDGFWTVIDTINCLVSGFFPNTHIV